MSDNEMTVNAQDLDQGQSPEWDDSPDCDEGYEGDEPEGKELASWLQNAIDLFDDDDLGHGDELTHNWLKHALQIPEPRTVKDAEQVSLIRLQRVEAFKDYLLTKRQMALKSVHGSGYYIVRPNQQARYAAETLAKGIHQATRKSVRILTWTDVNRLTAGERRRHVDTEVRIRGITELFSRERRKILIDIG